MGEVLGKWKVRGQYKREYVESLSILKSDM